MQFLGGRPKFMFKVGDKVKLIKATNDTWINCILTIRDIDIDREQLIGDGYNNDDEYCFNTLANFHQCIKINEFEIKTEADYYTWLANRT